MSDEWLGRAGARMDRCVRWLVPLATVAFGALLFGAVCVLLYVT